METTRIQSRAHAGASARPVWRSGSAWQLLAIIALGLCVRAWMGAQDDPAATVAGWGILAPLLIVSLQAAMAATPFGTSVLPVLNGALFPLPLALLLNIAGGAVGSTIMYFVWRRGEADFELSRRIDGLPPGMRRLVRPELGSLILMRVLPWAGGNLAALVAGSARVHIRTHLLATIVGSLPGSLIYALVGAGIVAL